MRDSGMLHGMNVAAYDLNHLRALHFLLDEAHVARAARRLGITPAAASNALRRLRADFDDPLLVRSGRALVRTPRAEQLRAPAREVLAAAERLFEVGAAFDPATDVGEFVLTTSDRVAELLLPTLDGLLRQRAPRSTLLLRTVTVDVAATLRERGGVAIVPRVARERGLRGESLFVDEFVCLMRRGHPLQRGPWTLARYAAAEHVVVAPLDALRRAAGDELLTAHGLSRRVTRVVTSFSLVAPLLVTSDRISTLPRSFALAQARAHGLVVRPMPVGLPPIEMQLVWHPGHEGDPRQVWLRALVREAASATRTRLPQQPNPRPRDVEGRSPASGARATHGRPRSVDHR
jgi:DNA-binding transcriptional LysR family regulator